MPEIYPQYYTTWAAESIEETFYSLNKITGLHLHVQKNTILVPSKRIPCWYLSDVIKLKNKNIKNIKQSITNAKLSSEGPLIVKRTYNRKKEKNVLTTKIKGNI